MKIYVQSYPSFSMPNKDIIEASPKTSTPNPSPKETGAIDVYYFRYNRTENIKTLV